MSLWDEAITLLEYYVYSLNDAALEDLSPFIMYPSAMPSMTLEEMDRFWNVYVYLSSQLEVSFFLADTIFFEHDRTLDFSEVFSKWCRQLLLHRKIEWINHRGFYQFLRDDQDLDHDALFDKNSYQHLLRSMYLEHPSMLLYMHEYNAMYSDIVMAEPEWEPLPSTMWPEFLDFAVKYLHRTNVPLLHYEGRYPQGIALKMTQASQRQQQLLEYKWDTFQSVSPTVKGLVLQQLELWEAVSPDVMALSGDAKASIFPYQENDQMICADFSEFEVNSGWCREFEQLPLVTKV